MPLTPLQAGILELLAANRSPSSHLAGATGIHLSSASPRRSADVDLFHDAENEVASAFDADREVLLQHAFNIRVILSQPGFIRAIVAKNGEEVRMDWAHDSRWRFMPPVRLEGAGYVLHPVDLAVNKALALAGRDEVRDFIDILYLIKEVLPLGALLWAAAGKDPGLNPEMLIELMARKGRFQQSDFDRLDLVNPIKTQDALPVFKQAIEEARKWISRRPFEEMGCLYRHPSTGLFFAPAPGEEYEIHRGAPGGVLPSVESGTMMAMDREMRGQLEHFFDRKLLS